MFRITVAKAGDPFTGGLYATTSVDNALAYYEANGYTVVMIESTSVI
tara:strand:- start:225 stop:365 length:141 start_codon:yes stop_codon:yes gene_type:complete